MRTCKKSAFARPDRKFAMFRSRTNLSFVPLISSSSPKLNWKFKLNCGFLGFSLRFSLYNFCFSYFAFFAQGSAWLPNILFSEKIPSRWFPPNFKLCAIKSTNDSASYIYLKVPSNGRSPKNRESLFASEKPGKDRRDGVKISNINERSSSMWRSRWNVGVKCTDFVGSKRATRQDNNIVFNFIFVLKGINCIWPKNGHS